jgi:hypothetical protein
MYTFCSLDCTYYHEAMFLNTDIENSYMWCGLPSFCALHCVYRGMELYELHYTLLVSECADVIPSLKIVSVSSNFSSALPFRVISVDCV